VATPFGPELEFPPDDFSSVTPAELAAASAEMQAEDGEIQFPEATFDDVTPEALAAARAEIAAEAGTPEDYRGDPFAALRSPSPEQPYIGFPTNPDEAPAEATPAALDLPAEPDAITGAGGVPLAPMAPGLGIPEAMFQAAMRGVPMETQGTPELPAEYLTNQEAGQAFARLTPEQQLNQQLDLEQRRSDMQRTALARASKADAEEAERDERDWRTSRETSRRDIEQIDAEAKAEAGREIDINRGWANASTGTKIAGIFSAFAGGLVAHKYGGKNSGLEMIDNLISRDIDAQKFNKSQRVNDLTRRGASARDRLAMAGDDFREETRLRLTSYDRVLGQIASDAQNFDPRGTQAIRYGQAYQDLAAKRAQTAADAQRRIADQYKEQLDFAGKELDLQKKQAELAKAQRAAMGGGGGGSGVSGKLTPDQWAAQYGEAGRPPSAMDAKEYKEWVVTGGKIATRASAQAEAETKNRENSPEWIAGELGAGDLVNEDGKPVLFRDATSAGRIAKKRGAVDTAARLIDQITAAREKYGWSSSLIKSKEYQDALADMGALIVAQKNDAELGALAAADMVLIEKMLGTTDPTEARDPTPGLKRARFNSINSLNEVIRSEARPGQKPKRYDIKAPNYEKPKETEEDRILARGLSSDVSSALAFAKDTENVEPSKRKAAPKSENELLEALKASGGIPPTIRAQLDKWEAEARSGDEKTSEKARAYLIEWSERGGSPQIRGAAETALFAANQGGVD
jgi:hypothetical protein